MTMPNSKCLTPGMSATLTTTGGPVLVMANIGGVWVFDAEGCTEATFFLVMDNTVISAHAIYWTNGGDYLSTENMVSWQVPAAGKHTFQVQEADYNWCGTYDQTVVGGQEASGMSSTRTLIVREF